MNGVCAQPLKVILVNHEEGDGDSSLRHLFMPSDGTSRRPGKVTRIGPMGDAPAPIVFDVSWDALVPLWTTRYGLGLRDPDARTRPLFRFLRMRCRTLDNPAYGVKGGTKVELLLLDSQVHTA